MKNIEVGLLEVAKHPVQRELPIGPVTRQEDAGISRAPNLGDQLRRGVAAVVRQGVHSNDVEPATGIQVLLQTAK